MGRHKSVIGFKMIFGSYVESELIATEFGRARSQESIEFKLVAVTSRMTHTAIN